MKKFFSVCCSFCFLFVSLTSCKKESGNFAIKSPNSQERAEGKDTDKTQNGSQQMMKTEKPQGDLTANPTDPVLADILEFSGPFNVGDKIRLKSFDLVEDSNGERGIAIFSVERGGNEFKITKELSSSAQTLIGSIEGCNIFAKFGSANVNIFIKIKSANNRIASFPRDTSEAKSAIFEKKTDNPQLFCLRIIK
jgi:hypothetical protein